MSQIEFLIKALIFYIYNFFKIRTSFKTSLPKYKYIFMHNIIYTAGE